MNKVYAMGVLSSQIKDGNKPVIKEQRLWNLYANFEDAESCVLENRGDIFEHTYNLALIEEVCIINHSVQNNYENLYKQWWYEAKFIGSDNDPMITKISKPKLLENIVNFWVG